jgi:hypothetical protein
MTKLNRNSFVEKKSTPLHRQIILAAMLFGIFVFANIAALAQANPCDVVAVQVLTRVSTNYADTQTGAFGYSRYEIRRNGETDHYIHLFYDAPDNTVFKAYFNGTEVTTLQRNPTSLLGEYWSWEGMDQSPVGHVGDVMSITMNGQPFVTGSYTREVVEYEAADASMQIGNPYPCSVYRGLAYLPNSSQPQTLRSAYMSAVTPVSDPATSITINEPGDMPGELGAEIAQVTLGTTLTLTGGWMATHIVSTNTVLTDSQYTMLRQGLLTVTTHTAAHPDGYSTMNIHTQGINTSSDLEGDGMTDLILFRPSEQTWYMKYSSNQQMATMSFGHVNDKLVVGDYDADRKADLATFQTDNPNFPGKGVWNIFKSSNGEFQTIQWGLSADIPLTLNIDTNNTTDICVFRPAKGSWYIMRMGDIIKPALARGNNIKGRDTENNAPQHITLQWGKEGDKPLVGDFDNDGIDELVIFRPSDGNWYIYNYARNDFQITHWGSDGDVPMARDFDGDGKADIAVYRPSNNSWYIYGSLEHNVIIRNFGIAGDIPVTADFDRDGVTDIAVFRPRNGTWYINRSSDNSSYSTRFGANGDIPAVAAQ